MITIENVDVTGFMPSLRGMRNPLNSWNRADSGYDDSGFYLGPNDYKLSMTLAGSGSPDRKFLRMVVAYMDITAPLYWWKEFDTYKVGTVANSCSTMHKIASKPFSMNDFSTEHLDLHGYAMMSYVVEHLEAARQSYLVTKDKKDWWQMIQLLPSSYNQKRTVMLNYETLSQMYKWRRNHKLDEWRTFCKKIMELPQNQWILKAAGADEEDE